MGPFNDKWINEPDFSEQGIFHRKLSEEYLFYKAVTEGNLSVIEKNLKQNKFIESKGVGKLSNNPIVNIKYHFVVTTAMITRFCSSAGMEIERAFRLSDYYMMNCKIKCDNKETHNRFV